MSPRNWADAYGAADMAELTPRPGETGPQKPKREAVRRANRERNLENGHGLTEVGALHRARAEARRDALG